MRLRTCLLALPILLGLASSANANSHNLVVNGSFQTPDVGTGWNLYDTIDGWSKVGTPKIEVGYFGLYGGITGTDGDQVCELDSTGNSRIMQMVPTEAGKRYKLSFLTAKRGGTSDASNQVTVYYDGAVDTINPTSTAMQEHSYTFTAVGASTVIEFEGGGTSDSLGSIIDNVRLVYDNVAPVANDDGYAVQQAGTLTKDEAEGVLSNDADGDNDPLTAELVTGPSNGSLVLNADGSFTYVPNVFFTGTDTFTYRAFDGFDYSAPATVTIEVLPPDAAGFITGGGRLEGVKRTFGFVAKVVGGNVKGSFEYQDHEVGNNVKSSSVDWVYVPSANLGYFSGTCSVNGVSGFRFFVEVHDNGQHDYLKVWVFDSYNNLVYQSEGSLFGGNIKIHGQ